LGLPYNGAIDMWSLACVCAEMYLGLPLFPGVSQHNQLSRIVEMLGLPPDFLLEGKSGRKYFTKVEPAPAGDEKKDAHFEASPQSVCVGSAGTHSAASAGTGAVAAAAGPGASKAVSTSRYRIKTAEEFAAETNTQVPVLRKYLRYSQLEDVIMRCPLPQKARMTQEQKNAETLRRRCFLDFLQGLFRLNPFERWTARQAFFHPFIEGSKFVGTYVPSPDMKINERKLNFMVLTQRKPPPSASYEPATLTGMRAPSNFSSVPGLLSANSAQFTPLHLAQRRMSDPGLGRSHAGSAATAAKASSGPQLLKRGAPAHLPSEASPPSPNLAESSIPFSASFSELPPDEPDAATDSGAAGPLVPNPTAGFGMSHVAGRAASGSIGESDIPFERAASDDRVHGSLPGASVARAILRVNSKGRDLQGLATAMQQQQQLYQHPLPAPTLSESPTQRSQLIAQQLQYQQFALAQQQQHHLHQQLQQSQSLHSSPQASVYLQQQYRQHHPHHAQTPQQYPRHQLPQHHMPPPQPWVSQSYGAPPRPYFPPHNIPPQQQGLPTMGAPAYPPFGAPIVSSMTTPMLGSSPFSNNSMGSSYNSYSYVGSMQDSAGVIHTDFAQALMRPDMDEQRRLLSQTTQQPMYWQQAAYGSPGAMASSYGYPQGYLHDAFHANPGGHAASLHSGHPAGNYPYPHHAPGHVDYGRGQAYYPPAPHQQSGSYDSKTMLARRRQHQDQQQQQQQLLRQDRNRSSSNLAEMSGNQHPHATPGRIPPVWPSSLPKLIYLHSYNRIG
jgi:hypothetical protein